MNSGYWIKADDLAPGSVSHMVAMQSPRRRIKRKVFDRIAKEFEEITVEINAMVIGQMYDPRLIPVLRTRLIGWAREMHRVGLFPLLLNPVISGSTTISIAWEIAPVFTVSVSTKPHPGSDSVN